MILNHTEICLLYLQSYQDKNLTAVSELFADQIVLRDWNLRVVGKDAALDETRKNFEAAQSLHIEVLQTYENTKSVAAELIITVNNSEILHVIDVLDFDDQGKIVAIRAYRGRGDE
ncbi:nuclear transport factor 2 family protein [Flavobacterium sp.]|uniref:nuclear transport factor 2 family protein n=1 Tax=Flavobacterium sp. TaxID=239 RepID=UPI002619B8AF|nr:nuclear transport factor 2 family protein [Flavobacterium sp.]